MVAFGWDGVLPTPARDQLTTDELMTEDYQGPTPPPERFKQWEDEILNERDNVDHVLDCAWRDGFRAGADQQLEACVEWVEREIGREWGAELRASRRPKPPSLAEEALSDFDGLMSELDGAGNYSNCAGRIRRALEQLDD